MIRGLSFHTQLNLHNDHNQLINILDIREILEYGFAPMVLGKISQEQTVLLQKSVANMEKNAREQKFSPKDEYHIHLKLYEPLNNPLLIQYLDAFWQIYQQVEKSLPPPILSPEKLAMQHRELIDAWKHMIWYGCNARSCNISKVFANAYNKEGMMQTNGLNIALIGCGFLAFSWLQHLIKPKQT